MMIMDYSDEFDQWINNEHQKRSRVFDARNLKQFIGERNYLHFDGRVLLKHHLETGDHQLANILKDPVLLAKHKFLPFIRSDIRVRRFRNKTGVQYEHLKHDLKFSTIKNRPIMFASHKDACIYSFYNFILSKKYEAKVLACGLTENILAYRKIPRKEELGRNKSNIDFAKEFYEEAKKKPNTGILMIDVSHFFDNLDHNLLLKQIIEVKDGVLLGPEELTIIKSLTSFRYVFKNAALNALGIDLTKKRKRIAGLKHEHMFSLCSPRDFNLKIKKAGLIKKNHKSVGIPQGSPISGLLANIYMLPFDGALKELVENKFSGKYGRYSDDIMVLVDANKLDEVYKYIRQLITKLKLEIKNKKTECFIYDGKVFKNSMDMIGIKNDSKKDFPQYLGFNFDNKEMSVRSSTLIRRFRGRDKLAINKWLYFGLLKKRLASKRISKQVMSIRKRIKKNDIIE